MPDPNPIAELQRCLLELGCPAKAARRIVRETAEHYDDLQEAALARGLPEFAAAACATEHLGDPRQLAERHFEALRAASWWGRHPVLGFLAVPLLAVPAIWFLCLVLGFGAGFSVIGAKFTERAAESQWILAHQATLFVFGFCTLWMGTAAMTIFAIRKIRRAVLGGRWLLTACGIISLWGLFFIVQLGISETVPYTFIVVQLSPWPDALSIVNASIPWAVVVWLYLRERRDAKALADAVVRA